MRRLRPTSPPTPQGCRKEAAGSPRGPDTSLTAAEADRGWDRGDADRVANLLEYRRARRGDCGIEPRPDEDCLPCRDVVPLDEAWDAIVTTEGARRARCSETLALTLVTSRPLAFLFGRQSEASGDA